MCGMVQSSHRTALHAQVCPTPSFHLCLGAEQSWVKMWKALTGNRVRVEILEANLRFSAPTQHVPHHSLPQDSADQTSEAERLAVSFGGCNLLPIQACFREIRQFYIPLI